MLILTRTPGEAVNLGDDIKVRVLRVRGQEVQIGIDAPEDVDIVREELLDDPAEAADQAASEHR